MPMEYGKDLLRTPDFLINLMGFAGTPGDIDFIYMNYTSIYIKI